MNTEGLRFLGSQLVYLLPTMLVLLVAIAMSIFCLGRARVPSVLTLVAAGTWLLTSIAAAVVQSNFVARANSGELPHEDLGVTMQVIGLGSSIVHAVCMALFVAAIFVGRKPNSAAA